MPKHIITAQQALRLSRQEGVHRVAPCLYLRVRGRSALWTVRVTMNAVTHEWSLGPFHELSLADAIARASDMRAKAKRGEIERPHGTRPYPSPPATPTFAEFAEQQWEALRHAWKNPKHAAQWVNTLRTYAYPVMGKVPVSEIDTGMVLAAVKPIWIKKHETATRLRQRIETVLSAAKAYGYRQGENPAMWRGHLELLLPAISKRRRVRHHPALPWRELPQFMVQLMENGSLSGLALQLLIMTACRTREVIEAQWHEFDLEQRVWTIPAARMKSSRPHRVPLSDQAVSLIERIPRMEGTAYVFPGRREGRPLSNMALLELVRGLMPGLTVHGFRSTFRDWVSEATEFTPELAEMALAHVIQNATEAAYRRGDMLERRRQLMQAWADFCMSVDSLSTTDY
jgi:integrase